MQTRLRTADPDKFPDRARLVLIKTQGRLPSAAAAAARVLEYLHRADFGNQPVVDLLEVAAEPRRYSAASAR